MNPSRSIFAFTLIQMNPYKTMRFGVCCISRQYFCRFGVKSAGTNIVQFEEIEWTTLSLDTEREERWSQKGKSATVTNPQERIEINNHEINDFFFVFFGHICPFCGATNTSVLDFWWHLPWVSMLGRIPSLAYFVACGEINDLVDPSCGLVMQKLKTKRCESLKQSPIYLQEVFFNYRFLHTKLAATSLQDILSDFRTAAECGLGDEESQLLENTLRVGPFYYGSFLCECSFND